jgi:hypothetical protein
MTTSQLPVEVSEGTTPTYRCLISDDTGVAIHLAALTALTLTVCASGPRDVINGRKGVNILNANGGTFLDPPGLDQNGNTYNLQVLLQTTDTIMLDPTLDQEWRSVIIEWTYNSGLSVGKHEVQFPIVPIRPG